MSKGNKQAPPKQSYQESGGDVTTDARVLFDAVRHGKNHLVRFILEASAVDIVNSRDLHGKTPLMACCYTKEEGARDNTVKLLLRHGADVNYTDDFGRSVLSYVCEKRCNDILRILVKEHNIDPDIPDVNGNTPLIYSAMVGNDIACDILIRHFRRLGLNVDAINEEGLTALLMAAKHGNITCAQILVGQGKASLRHKDTKYGYSVEEWLAKKGFTMQDIKPVRHDGKGRSRFLRVANIAAVCSAPKKVVQQPEFDFSNVHVERVQRGDDDYTSDGTTVTDTPTFEYGDFEIDMGGQHFRVVPYVNKPRMRNKETQTLEDQIEEMSEAETYATSLGRDEHGRLLYTLEPIPPKTKENKELSPDKHVKGNSKNKSGCESHNGNSFSKQPRQDVVTGDKRLSLPDIDSKGRSKNIYRNSTERKSSLDVLPEKLIANIDIGDGRRHSIQIHTDTVKRQVYWSPYKDGEDEDDQDDRPLLPLKFDRARVSVSDSETSTNDYDGPIF